ncbi:MAG: polyprenol monophosphomannose synthase [Chloroflexi bacterium]|nr:polyprenol monophosphomannose synthase [Chloroflexota bacterium]MBU1749989.1 polyprenol monophosphomannose synthase [Chloroflexota bacterium]
MTIAIVVPTYNERDNIGRLVEALLGLGRDLRVIIVDDNSPDGTGPAADELAAQHSEVHVIHRAGKGGRGAAVLAGFREALSTNADLFVEMDADFSHDPAELYRLLDAAAEYDMVIGSRDLPGSRIVNWPWRRTVFHFLANIYARLVLGIPVRDYTNGYRLYHRRVLEALDFDAIQATGYIVLSEVLVQVHRAGFRIGEVPTTFVNRRRGVSNVTPAEITEAFTGVLKLRRRYR